MYPATEFREPMKDLFLFITAYSPRLVLPSSFPWCCIPNNKGRPVYLKTCPCSFPPQGSVSLLFFMSFHQHLLLILPFGSTLFPSISAEVDNLRQTEEERTVERG